MTWSSTFNAAKWIDPRTPESPLYIKPVQEDTLDHVSMEHNIGDRNRIRFLINQRHTRVILCRSGEAHGFCTDIDVASHLLIP